MLFIPREKAEMLYALTKAYISGDYGGEPDTHKKNYDAAMLHGTRQDMIEFIADMLIVIADHICKKKDNCDIRENIEALLEYSHALGSRGEKSFKYIFKTSGLFEKQHRFTYHRNINGQRRTAIVQVQNNADNLTQWYAQ